MCWTGGCSSSDICLLDRAQGTNQQISGCSLVLILKNSAAAPDRVERATAWRRRRCCSPRTAAQRKGRGHRGQGVRFWSDRRGPPGRTARRGRAAVGWPGHAAALHAHGRARMSGPPVPCDSSPSLGHMRAPVPAAGRSPLTLGQAVQSNPRSYR